jgi:small nuclear ribonucleoprotein (snRNP)-like protein
LNCVPPPSSRRGRFARCSAAKTLVQLRDGRKIIGIMRSFDQFANVVLEEAFERIIFGGRFADVPLGLYVIRGENVVLLGQIVRSPQPAVATPLTLQRRARPRRPTTPDARAIVRTPQDEAKEAQTIGTLLTPAPVEELLLEKRDAEEAQKLKASLSRAASRAAQDPWEFE